MDKNFKLQRIEPINPEVEQIGHFTLPEFAQNLDRIVSDSADHKIADSLIGFMLNKDISAAEAKTILASIQNSKNILHSTKDLAQNAYNKINLKTENLVGIEKEKNQIFVDQARAVAHDAFIDIVSKYFHGIKIETLESDKEISEFLLKNYPEIITSIKLQDPNKIFIGDQSLVEVMKKIEKNDPHSNYATVARILVDFISGSEIRDSFNNDTTETDNVNKIIKKRKEFIDKVTKKIDGTMRNLFDSNRFKYKNLRGVVDTSIYELLEVDFPQELKSQREDLEKEIAAFKGNGIQRNYDFMNDTEKEVVVVKVDELARKILEDILQKHLH
ncbi:MAG: hypothetical protein WC089_03970 [Candidatus Paceibacterota bacterium]